LSFYEGADDLKTKVLIGLGILVVFGVGFLAGVMGAGIWVKARFEEFSRGETSRFEQIVAKRGVKRLEMDEGQATAFRELVAEAGGDVREIQAEAGLRVKRMLGENYEPRMLEILNEAQAAEWEAWKREMREKGSGE
jgi:hypothetical protein